MELDSMLEHLHVADPAVLGDLMVCPLLIDGQGGAGELVDVDEAIEEGWLEVTEVSESGSVPDLAVSNGSEKTIIVFDGEELIGAKQNRIVNVTIIIPAFSRLVVPVSCVEQGRWHWRGRGFTSGEVLYASLRRQKFEQVSTSLREVGSHLSNQGAIWEDISAKLFRMGVSSDTGAMKDLADKYRLEDDKLKENFQHLENQVGYLAFVREGFAGGELFPSGKISQRKFFKMLRSYYLDSLDPETKFPVLGTNEILAQVRSSARESVPAIGAGQEYRFRTDKVQGALTVFQGNLAHLEVFPQ